MSVFARFPPRLQEAIVARLGWSSLRPVQEEAGEALLAGRNAVVLAPRGRQPTWGGFLPQFLGHTVCQKMLEVLTSEETYAYLTPAAAEALAQQREGMAEVLTPSLGGIELDADEVRWWTYAGGAINSTLRQALGAVHADWKVTTDNVLVRVRREDLDGGTFAQALEQLTAPAFWDDEALWREVVGSLPGYRLSKFQPLMPPWVEREVLGRYLLDVAGTKAWLLQARRSPP